MGLQVQILPPRPINLCNINLLSTSFWVSKLAVNYLDLFLTDSIQSRCDLTICYTKF